MRPWLLGIARTWTEHLARLHTAGWAHADVQPTNTLITQAGATEVIDYALACGPDDRPRLPYRGALTHTTAPEIADAILATPADTHIQAQPAGGHLGTGRFAVLVLDRPPAGPLRRRQPTRGQAQGHREGRHPPLDDARPWTFTEFEKAIPACLAPAPEDRPSATDLVALLTPS